MKTHGVDIYEMYFSARIEFPQGFIPKTGGFWSNFGAGAEMMGTLMTIKGEGFSVVKGGQAIDPQVLEANAKMTFRKTEKGWVVEHLTAAKTAGTSGNFAPDKKEQADKPEISTGNFGSSTTMQVMDNSKERIRLILQVMTDDTLNVYLNQSAEQIAQELKSRNITFESSRKSPNEGDYSILVRNVGYDGANEAREYLQNFNSRFNLSSSIMEGNTNFTLTLKSGEVSSLRQSTVRLALETVRRRVDALGIAEPTFQIQGNREQEVEDRIIIEIPAVNARDKTAYW